MDYRSLAYQTAQKYGINPDLFVRQIQAESAFNPAAVSSAGAIGLGQLMPATAKELGVDPTDPAQNLEGAARYMKQLLGRYKGDQTLALAAYNAGMGNVDKAGGVPNFKETQNYIAKIMGSNMAQQPTQQPQQQGLLGGILGGRGIGGALGLSDDMRDKLKMGFLLGSDPRAFAPMVQAIQARGQERRAQNKAQQSANVTADYLDSIGQKDIANLVRQQAIGGAEGLKLGTAGSGTDTTDYKNYMAIKATRPDLTFEQYMSEKDRKPLQSKGTYRYGDRVIGEVTFDPNTGEYFEVVDGQRQPIDISQARPITDATFAKAIPNYSDFVKLTDELSQDVTSMDRLQEYMKTIGNTNVGFQRLGDQMTASLKTLLSGIAGPEWTKLTKDELNAAVAKGQLQGLIGRFRIETVGGGVMTEQDALRIIANLGGDVNALQNPEIVAQQIETLFKGKYKSFENKRKRHDSAIDALYGGMGFENIEEYEFDESIFDLKKPASEVSDAELLKGAQGLTGEALEQYLQSLSSEAFARLFELMSQE